MQHQGPWLNAFGYLVAQIKAPWERASQLHCGSRIISDLQFSVLPGDILRELSGPKPASGA